MGKIVSFMHISLDGFVAGPNGEMDWITINNEIFEHVGKRIREGDSALYGRVTYQMMESYWPAAGTKPSATQHEIEHSKWYGSIRKIVLSKTLTQDGLENTQIISDNLSDRVNETKRQTDKEILIFGSPTATRSLMQLGLIDGYWLFVNPVVLGEGIPLFAGIKNRIKLKLLTTSRFDCGVTELSYILD